MLSRGFTFRPGTGRPRKASFLRAIELDLLNNSTTLEYAGLYLNLMGRHEQALQQARHALTSAPASPGLRTGVGVCLLKARRYDEAIAAFRDSLDLRETPATLTFLGMALARKGRYKEAFAFQQRARSMSPPTIPGSPEDSDTPTQLVGPLLRPRRFWRLCAKCRRARLASL
jgi:tetratricopeptide (TPR) repeat protein